MVNGPGIAAASSDGAAVVKGKSMMFPITKNRVMGLPMFLLLISSCTHPPLFDEDINGSGKMKLSSQFRHQVAFHPLSLEYLRVSGMYDATYEAIAQGIEKRINKPDELSKYVEYLKQLDSYGNIILKNVKPHFREGDELYWYQIGEEASGSDIHY